MSLREGKRSRPKRTAFLLIVSNLLFFTPARGFALAPKGTPERKFERGLLNVAFAPLEISEALAQDKKQKSEFPSWAVLGLGQGAFLACLRAFTGVYEILTFPLPIPPRYEAISEPEFALEYLGLMKDEPPQEKKAS